MRWVAVSVGAVLWIGGWWLVGALIYWRVSGEQSP